MPKTGNARLQGRGFLTNMIGNPLETTTALAHLIYEGTLDKFPGLKLAASHGGGYLASYIGRFDHGHNSADRGGLGLSGIQGGGWLGWGMKTADDLYFGAEISGAGSDEKIELTSSVGLQDSDGQSITSASAKRNWVAGGALRVGYYVNASTLFSLTGGIAVSQFDVDIGSDSQQYYAGGPQVGAQVETQLSKIDPNLSLRMEFVYTDYLTADINGMDGVGQNSGNDSELTGSDSAGRIGVAYRF